MVEKLKGNKEVLTDFKGLFNMIKSFSSVNLTEKEWNNLEKILLEMEKGVSKTKTYNYKKLSYFCDRINETLAQNSNLKLEYNEILKERNLIGLKIQMALYPILITNLKLFTSTQPTINKLSFQKVKNWELDNNTSKELSYFLNKNFGKNTIDKPFVDKLSQEVETFINQNNDLILQQINEEEIKNENNMFKLSLDKKFVHFYKGNEEERWNLINQEFLNTHLTYEDVQVSIEVEALSPQSDKLRFNNLYRALYPQTRSCTVIIHINNLLAELIDLQELVQKKQKQEKIKCKYGNYKINDNEECEDFKPLNSNYNKKQNRFDCEEIINMKELILSR